MYQKNDKFFVLNSHFQLNHHGLQNPSSKNILHLSYFFFSLDFVEDLILPTHTEIIPPKTNLHVALSIKLNKDLNFKNEFMITYT